MAKKDKGKAKQKKVMKDKPKAKSKKVGKKSFYEVSANLVSSKIKVYGSTLEEFEGKTVKLDLTKSLRGRSFEIIFKLNVEKGELIGEPICLRMISSYVRKMVRKGTDYVEDSFIIGCRDKMVRIKPFLITRNKVSRAVRGELRRLAKDWLSKRIKTRNAEEIFEEIMSNKIQKELSLKLKKIYPLALCEIRVLEIVGDKDDEKEGENVSEKKEG
jgi:ribosomal protein S3AE